MKQLEPDLTVNVVYENRSKYYLQSLELIWIKVHSTCMAMPFSAELRR